MDDGPEDRVVVGVRDGDGERRTKAGAVFGALYADAVAPSTVHDALPLFVAYADEGPVEQQKLGQGSPAGFDSDQSA